MESQNFVEDAILMVAGLFLFVFLVTSLPTNSLTGYVVSLNPDSVTVDQGAEVLVYVDITDVTDLIGAEFDISYDSTVLSYVGITEGTFLNSDGSATFLPDTIDHSTPGSIQGISIIRINDSGVNGNGRLLTIRFTAVGEGQSNIEFTHTALADSQANPISQTVSGTTVTVAAQPPALAPTEVTITSPAGEAVVNQTISLAATVSDDTDVSAVRFLLGEVLLAEDSSAPYLISWNTSQYENRQYTINVRAVASGGVVLGSSNITVTTNNDAVSDTESPIITIITPTPGAEVSGTAVAIEVNVTDNVNVQEVRFFANSDFLGTDTTEPYTSSFNSEIYENTATIRVDAEDFNGNIATESFSLNTPSAAPAPRQSGGGGGGGGGGGVAAFLPGRTSQDTTPQQTVSDRSTASSSRSSRPTQTPPPEQQGFTTVVSRALITTDDAAFRCGELLATDNPETTRLFNPCQTHTVEQTTYTCSIGRDGFSWFEFGNEPRLTEQNTIIWDQVINLAQQGKINPTFATASAIACVDNQLQITVQEPAALEQQTCTTQVIYRIVQWFVELFTPINLDPIDVRTC